jgi:glycosyltransferase involved in cell wall biosynthesis
MPRLLMACSTITDGSGMMAAVAPLARELGRLGARVGLLGPSGRRPRAISEAEASGTRVQVARRSGLTPRLVADAWKTASAFAEWARGKGAGVVHVHGVWTASNLAACISARSLGVPCVISPHGMLMPAAMRRSNLKKRAALWACVRRNLEAAAVVHVSSEAERASVLAVAPRARTRVIPWGVDVCPADAAETRRDSGRRRAAYVGRIIPLKGVDDLLAAWAEVRPCGWDLRFVGDDPEGHGGRLAQAIAATDLGGTVSVHPAMGRDDVARLIRQLDLLVLPSHSENFGMVVAEALAAGVPVITTTATPWSDVVDRQCGWWVPDTPAGLAGAIADATSRSDANLTAMGERGRSWMQDSFAWPTIAARFAEELYRPWV